MKSVVSHRLPAVFLYGLFALPLAAAHATGSADGGDFQFKSGVRLETGRQHVDQSGALLSHRHDNARGANVSDSAERYRLQLFGYQKQPGIHHDGLSVNYIPARQGSGASLQLNDMQQWKFRSDFFTSSETADAGPYLSESSAWNIAADRRWLKGSVQTRVEYARSQNSGFGADEFSDDAMDVRVDMASGGWLRVPLLKNWNAGVRYRSIGPQYVAADVYLPSGQQETSAFFTSSLSNFTFDVGWREQSQQLGEALARLENRAMMSVRYAPAIGEENLLRSWFGNPSLVAHYHLVEETTPSVDWRGNVLGDPLLNDIDERGIALELQKQFWQWRVEYQQALPQLHSDVAFSVEEPGAVVNGDRSSTLLNVTLNPAGGLALSANAQRHRQLVNGMPEGNQRQFYNIVASFDVIPDTCSISLQYDHSRTEGAVFNGTGISWGATNSIGSAALSWRAITFNGSRPALDLSLRSSYGRLGDALAMSVDEKWAAQLSMKMYWGRQAL